MAKGTLTIGLVLALAVAGSAVLAQTPLEVTTQPGLQERGAILGGAEMPLSLQKAISLALEHNINLEVSRLSLAASTKAMIAATGIFDPVASADLTESSSKSPATNQLVGAAVNVSKSRSFNLGYSQFLPTGANLGVQWTNRRTETNSTFYFLNPAYNAGLSLTFTQPLLSGFGTDVNRAGIEVARRSSDISQLEFERIVIATVQQVENGYWALVYARENLKVEQQSLKLAQDLLDQTKTRVRIGTSAPIDIVQSEATVATREQSIIVAENAVDNAADQLKQLMGFENVNDWKTSVVPTDSLDLEHKPVDLDAAIAKAIDSRVELRERALSQQISEINVVSADNATKPRLDLNIGYGYSGVGGTYFDSQTGITTPGGWSDALRQIKNGDYNNWSAGVSLSYPLGNHEAKARLAQNRFQLESAKQTLALERQGVIAEVRNAVRAVEASAKSILAASKARELAERNLDAEQKKFANGMSTNYQVLKIQEDLAAAQVAELQSRVAYRQSLVAYDVAEGTLLRNMGVKLAGTAEEKEPHQWLKDTGWLKYSHWAKPLAAPTEATPEAGGKASPAGDGTDTQ